MLAGGEQPAWCCDICCAEQLGVGGAAEQRIFLSAYSKCLCPYSSQVLWRLSLTAGVDTDSWIVFCFQADPCWRPTGQCCVSATWLKSCCACWRLPGASCLPWLGHDKAFWRLLIPTNKSAKVQKVLHICQDTSYSGWSQHFASWCGTNQESPCHLRVPMGQLWMTIYLISRQGS